MPGAGHAGWHRTTHCRTTTFPNCFALVAQASLPAIRLWMFPQMLLMAGRDARPTVLNITFYLKTPISRATHRVAPTAWVRNTNTGRPTGSAPTITNTPTGSWCYAGRAIQVGTVPPIAEQQHSRTVLPWWRRRPCLRFAFGCSLKCC
jgi:hypothetical protein